MRDYNEDPFLNIIQLLREIVRKMDDNARAAQSRANEARKHDAAILDALTDMNESNRWMQEWFKTQTLEVQEALADRKKEAVEWQRNPQFEAEVEKRFDMEVKKRIYEATTLAANQALVEERRVAHQRRSDAARRAAATRNANAQNR